MILKQKIMTVYIVKSLICFVLQNHKSYPQDYLQAPTHNSNLGLKVSRSHQSRPHGEFLCFVLLS